jgi:DNA-binding CsgD family transcriptional regulator
MEPCAFIFYCPSTNAGKPQVYSNGEAVAVLENFTPLSGDPPIGPRDLTTLSARWKSLLDSRANGTKPLGKNPPPDPEFLEMFQSQRRKYAVKGMLLSEQPPTQALDQPPPKTGSYLFILERMNLAIVFREYHLSPREQEVVRLLLEGLSNKEIAEKLGIRINTVKDYLKMLTRKLGVGSRTGIVSCILSGPKKGSSDKLSLA